MRPTLLSSKSLRLAVSLCLATAVTFGASTTASLTKVTPDVKSAGQLAFGPDGVLFVGDALGASIFALDTQDTQPAASAGTVGIKAINEKIAAMLGTMPDQILINDIKVNPISKKIYISVSRGRGPDGTPVILRIDTTGKMEEFPLAGLKYSVVSLPGAPEWKSNAAAVRRPEGMGSGNPRSWTITDLHYMNGNVIVAGLSNEEFSSDLRSVPFPFHGADRGTSSVEIWHSQHGRYETQSPVRTFIPYQIDKQDFILATYSCTPLVKMPVGALKPGAKVEGETIAELGSHNTPLEMIPYRKGGHDYILVANSTRGIMKVSADDLGIYKPIVPKSPECAANHESTGAKLSKDCGIETAGPPVESINEFKGVLHMAKADDAHAVLLTDSAPADKVNFVAGNATGQIPELNGTMDLKTIVLP